MAFIPLIPEYTVLSNTATDDTTWPITTLDIWMLEADIFITTQGATMGSKTIQPIALSAGTVYTVKGPVNIRDYLFKNTGAGLNTTVTVAGTRLSDRELRGLGLV